MHKIFFKAASVIAMLAVVIGAFGAHLLKEFLPQKELDSIQTAVTYQMSHAIALFLAGLLYRIYHNVKIKFAGYLFLTGVILFSGSIYLRIFLTYVGFSKSNIVAAVTPFGGASLIIGWLFLMFAIPSSKKKYHDSSE
jgi:uncharacterized membrane protein YgdD (TMEM256/DUF423 family)